MADKRLNILVYAGNGSTIESVRHCVYSLRRLLSPTYAVLPITGDALIYEPWPPTCALLVMPGGADLGFCRTLNGAGNRRITLYVESGGSYLGLCAGGYYGSARCEFEVGRQMMEVVGDRELAFFPGICRGLAFPGFVYHSERGARAVRVRVDKSVLSEGSVPGEFRCYYNGGGVFVDAERYEDQGVQVLASYTEDLNVESGTGKAAVVYRKVGEGHVVLTSPHPEFAAVNLDRTADAPDFVRVVDALTEDDQLRTNFLKACLAKLGLKVNEDQNVVPSLSRIHISSLLFADTTNLLHDLSDIIIQENGQEYIKDENDTFLLEKPSTWSTESLKDALPRKEADEADEDRILDYNTIVKRVYFHENDLPLSRETPYFNHHAYFSNLTLYQETSPGVNLEFGKRLMYGEVVTSTNTLLEKNTQILRRLPSGFLASATVQVAGRGRGSNVWVSPAGSLMFSIVVRHETALMAHAPVIFLQYLAALAIVEGVNTYAPGYANLPVRLKWPNDIYALDPTKPASEKAYVKIGGILVNSHYSSSEYLSVIGIGLNTTNTQPTTSLSALLPSHLPAFTPERLLARLVTTFSTLYAHFRLVGWNSELEAMYYRYWLHTDQIVTLEQEGGMRARIKGITRDWGLLVAEELGWEDRGTGKLVTLQSDSNSFDFFRGLLKRKI